MSHMDYGFYFFEGKKIICESLFLYFFFVTTACWLVPNHHQKRLTGSVPNTSPSTQPLPEIPHPQAKITPPITRCLPATPKLQIPPFLIPCHWFCVFSRLQLPFVLLKAFFFLLFFSFFFFFISFSFLCLWSNKYYHS